LGRGGICVSGVGGSLHSVHRVVAHLSNPLDNRVTDEFILRDNNSGGDSSKVCLLRQIIWICIGRLRAEQKNCVEQLRVRYCLSVEWS
jgi:hypothetical protein